MEAEQKVHVKVKYRGLNPRFPKAPRGLLSVIKK